MKNFNDPTFVSPAEAVPCTVGDDSGSLPQNAPNSCNAHSRPRRSSDEEPRSENHSRTPVVVHCDKGSDVEVIVLKNEETLKSLVDTHGIFTAHQSGEIHGTAKNIAGTDLDTTTTDNKPFTSNKCQVFEGGQSSNMGRSFDNRPSYIAKQLGIINGNAINIAGTDIDALIKLHNAGLSIDDALRMYKSAFEVHMNSGDKFEAIQDAKVTCDAYNCAGVACNPCVSSTSDSDSTK